MRDHAEEDIIPDKLLHWGKVVGQFAVVQSLVQLIGALSGFVVVRLLDKDQYALFTIASSLQATANLLTDCGINAGLLSIGGRIWTDPARMGRLVASSLRLRRKLSFAAAVCVGPLSVWLLVRNGASPLVAAGLTALVLATFQFVGASMIFAGVLKLNSRYSDLQSIDLASSTVRLTLVGTSALAFLDGLLATLYTSVSQMVQYFVTKTRAARHFALGAQPDPDYSEQLARLVHGNVAFSAYVAVQGQIAVFILSMTAGSAQIADIGALNRLAIAGTVVITLLNYVASPAFAKADSADHLSRSFGIASAGVGFAAASIVAACALFPHAILWLLGSRYMHLERELLLVGLGLAMSLVLSLLWTINTARAWLRRTWIVAPFTVLLQIALAFFLDLSRVSGILWFTVLSQIPNMAWSAWLAYCGLRSLRD